MHERDQPSEASTASGAATTDGHPSERGVDRRDFLRSALAVGGAGALSTVTGLAGVPDAVAGQDDDEDDPSAPSYAERSNRQHAWDDHEKRLSRGATKPPDHHLLLHVDYRGSGEPTPEDRHRAERAFRSLEETVGWDHEGVLFTVGYSPAYFDRFRDGDEVVMPAGLDPENGGLDGKQGLVRPDPLIDDAAAPHEDPGEIAADQFDAVIHLASDDAATLLHAEAALWGVNPDVELAADLDGVFTRPESFPARRVGFIGHDNIESMDEFDQVSTGEGPDGVYPEAVPDENQYADHHAADGDHPAAGLSMGFNDLYGNSNPEETNATILEDQQLVEAKPPGVFAQGTIMHVAHLDVKVDDWYDNNQLAERRAQMFSPHHDATNTGVTGENLGISNAPGEEPLRDLSADGDVARSVPEDAEQFGVAGHAQKCARARFDLESRLTDRGVDTYRALDRYDAATERADSLPGHDGVQDSEQVVLRRDFDAATGGQASNNFVALMRFNPYMSYLRAAMNGGEFDTSVFGLDPDGDGFVHPDIRDQVTGEDKAGFVNPDGDGNRDNGIVPYLRTNRRGNYLVPPLTERALPPASAREVEVDVSVEPGRFVVRTDAVDVGALDPERVQFGFYLDVNRQRGVEPVVVEGDGDGDGARLVFPTARVDLGEGTPRAGRLRFRATDPETGEPLRATVTVDPETVPDRGEMAERFDRATAGTPGEIEAQEVLDAIETYNDGSDLTPQEVLAIIEEYNGDGEWRNVDG